MSTSTEQLTPEQEIEIVRKFQQLRNEYNVRASRLAEIQGDLSEHRYYFYKL